MLNKLHEIILILVITVAAVSFTSHTGSAKPSDQPEPAATNQVVIQNFAFAPATITVASGTKVTWTNRDDDPHTVDETNKVFKSGTMDTGDQYSYTFNSPGTFSYFCALHPKMVGQVIVK